MLTFLKAAAGTWIAKILLGLLVLSFAVWGITGASFNFASGQLASVGSSRISTLDFQQEYIREIRRIGNQIGRPLTPTQAQQFGLDRQVLSRMINEAILDDRVNSFGIGVSQDRIADDLLTDPTFQDANGNFNAFRYQQLLINAQISEKEFLAQQEGAIERRQIVDGLIGDVTPSNTLQEALTAHTNEERDVDFIVVDARDVPSVRNPEENELEVYFNFNKSRYRAPEYRSLVYLALDAEDLGDSSSISEDEVRDLYDREKQRYSTAEKRNIQRITFNNPSEASAAAIKLKNGTSFPDLLSELSLNDEDVSLGLLEKTAILDSKLADTAFSLPLNTPSEVIDGDFGKVIVYVDQIEEAKTESFDTVKDAIRSELLASRNSLDLQNRVDEIEDARAAGNTFEEIAQRFNMTLVSVSDVASSGALSAGGEIDENTPVLTTLLDEAFNTDVGVENDFLEVGRTGYLWFEVTDVKPARDRTLEEVQAQVLQDWRNQELTTAVTKKAEEIHTKLADGKTLRALAESEGLLVRKAEGCQTGTTL